MNELQAADMGRREILRAAALLGGLLSLRATPAMSGAAGDPSPASLGISEASRRLRAGEITSEALTRACLERIHNLDGQLNAFITVMAREALTQARLLDEEARQGHFRGALHGLPIVLKDNIDTGGVRTTAASEIFDDRVPAEDAFVVARLKAAGAVVLGKTNMHEFAMGRTSATSYFGPVHNPWALDLSPGGSSGGSAVAVISDMCVAAVGTDTGGSIRMPSAYCGTVGLKPTYGLVSLRGIVPLAYSLDHCGPMTKTVTDAAILLNVMTGYDKRDVASLDRAPEDYTRSMRQPIAGLRLGIPRAPFFDRLDPQIAAAVESAIELLSGMTAGARDVSMPSTNAGDMSLGSPLAAETLAYHRPWIRRSGAGYSMSIRRRLQDLTRDLDNVSIEPASEKVADYIQASRDLAITRKTIDDSFADFDLLVLPTMRLLQPKISEVLERDETMTPKARQPERDNNCAAFNQWGIPAISIPCGFSKEGLPIGLMIAGPRFSEGRVLALAAAYEQATSWHLRRPMPPKRPRV